MSLSYQDSANFLYQIKEESFGDPELDAENLKSLCEDIVLHFPEFCIEFKTNHQNKLSSLFFATPGMKDQYSHYNNLLILDTTFGTNRFKMPLMVGTLVNNMGRTVLCFFALVAEETSIQFQWVFEKFKESFGQSPKNIITDECGSFQSAISAKFPESEHFICSWHKMNNIIKQLSQKGCYRKANGNILKFLFYFIRH